MEVDIGSIDVVYIKLNNITITMEHRSYLIKKIEKGRYVLLHVSTFFPSAKVVR